MSGGQNPKQVNIYLQISQRTTMLHKALKLIRVFHELKQKELAEQLEISTSHLSEIESGKKTPTLSVLTRYAKIFEVPVSSILFFSENLDSGVAPEKTQLIISSKILAMMNFVAERSK